MATLNIAGDNAGTKNRRSELSMPIIATATATVPRNGSMMRVSSVVSSSFPGVSANDGAKACVIGEAKTIPISTSTPVIRRSAFTTRLPRCHAASRPSVVSARVNVGTNAAVIAPSAKRSRNRFGIRNATLKASISMPPLAPKNAASTISRATPSTRLAMVATLMSPADRASVTLIVCEA